MMPRESAFTARCIAWFIEEAGRIEECEKIRRVLSTHLGCLYTVPAHLGPHRRSMIP
jgi:hypothetical protein